MKKFNLEKNNLETTFQYLSQIVGMNMEKQIKKIIVDQVGAIFYNPESSDEKEREPIEKFYVNGEMASVAWYKQGNREFNGKFVIEVEYL